eukprot:CAMPEP_0184701594 /NCGR_PEP_ID=MMETSP0313-20130426/20580_1 /TAXON_ID=2792 /ORGANISM="Porphyridium aerugineum, Strain SAG 1380-2" /LENGTH=46 /DNA_ID= /DNA_START= /DNA_END= /DNA_ORIENTATION=
MQNGTDFHEAHIDFWVMGSFLKADLHRHAVHSVNVVQVMAWIMIDC